MTGIVFTGLWYAVGNTVSAFVAGLDCGDYVVAGDGTVTVPYQSDPSQLLTPAYVKAQSDLGPTLGGWVFTSQVTVTIGGLPVICNVPVSIGYTYTSKGQLVRPNAEKMAQTRQGPALGELRRTHRFAVQLETAWGVSFGTTFSNLHPAKFTTDGGSALPSPGPFNGVYRDEIEDDYTLDGQLCWQVTRPVPCTIVALEGFAHTEEI